MEKEFKNYYSMVKDEEEARRLMHRPKHWQKEERLKDKRRKKHTWATKGALHQLKFLQLQIRNF